MTQSCYEHPKARICGGDHDGSVVSMRFDSKVSIILWASYFSFLVSMVPNLLSQYSLLAQLLYSGKIK